MSLKHTTNNFSNANTHSKQKQNSAITSSENEYSFFDEATIFVRAGSGGQGASTYKKAKKGQDGIPDGGSGGMGGNVVLEVDPSLNTLASFTTNTEQSSSFRAQGGTDGGRMYDNGRNGQDFFIRVPPGTVVSIVQEEQQGEEEEEEILEEKEDNDDDDDDEDDLLEIGTLTLEEPTLVVARGGKGGEGTAVLKGKKKGATRKGPQGGERFHVRLTLKLIADVALCGVPNAGKSTFLAAVTRAQPKIANYPFTTVVPNIGVWVPPTTSTSANQGDSKDKAAGSTGIVLCDVPGLIAGAADGVGLGHAFLRHVERCRVILHLVDSTSDDPVGDFVMVNHEIQRYGSGTLANMPQVVVVNKMDLWEEKADEEAFDVRKKDLATQLQKAMGHTRLLWISAKERQNVDDVMLRMAAYVRKIKESENEREESNH